MNYDNEEVPHTIHEWNVMGFLVKAGEKATGHVLGHATFTRDQVIPMKKPDKPAPADSFSF